MMLWKAIRLSLEGLAGGGPSSQVLEEIDVREGLSRAGKREEKRAHRQ
jgi:hypothetical protein